MSKMNRRDYLIQMSAASAFAGMSHMLSPSSISAEVRRGRSSTIQTAKRATFLFTPKTATPPSPTNLTVLFRGLMGFSNSYRGEVQVGFQKGTGKHKLEIKIYQKIGNSCYQLPSITSNDLAGVKTMDLTIRDQPSNVNFFHKEDFERNPSDDIRDFGWVLDFEDSLLYPDGVTLIKKFSPVLKLHQGTFYTHQLTNSKFDLIEVPANASPRSVNQVPRLVGSAMDIPAGKEAILRLDGTVAAQFPYIANVSYEIQFMNDCFDGGHHCAWPKPKDPNEKIRNDFYMHYFMFKPKNSSAKKYGLMLNHELAGSTLNICPPPIAAGTDEAPCMATGFGRQPGF